MRLRLTSMLLLIPALFAPSLLAQATDAPAPPPTIKFDVISFKRCDAISGNRKTEDPVDGDFIARHCQSIHALLDFAFYDVGTHLLKSQPDWVETEGFEFMAKVAAEDVPAWHMMSLGTKRLMLRTTLVESLNLKEHIELQPRPIYALVVAKDGPKMTEHKPGPDDPPPGTLIPPDVQWVGPDEAAFTNASMSDLVSSLSARLGRNVVDETGLAARYDFHVQPLPVAHYSSTSADAADIDVGAILNGVRTLGLRLDSAKADTTVIVIDHIDPPAKN
jgi:uncharacterized protein (TIGR03435 family)